MSRITAPVSKLSRAMAASPGPVGRSLLDSSAATLMPKYAELLRPSEPSDASPPGPPPGLGLVLMPAQSRGLATAHRPRPQPSLANRSKPLMQTFHSTVAAAVIAVPRSHLDTAVLPGAADLAGPGAAASGPRMPLLPDNYAAAHGPLGADAPVHLPEISIVAANPGDVVPANALSEVEGIGVDGVELKFAHEDGPRPRNDEPGGGMIRDLWKGMLDDVLGPANKTA